MDKEAAKQCLECSGDIPISAKKCAKCGSYQNWQRYTPFGTSTIALILSLIALFASLAPDIRPLLKSSRDYFSGTNFSFSAALVEMSEERASFLVSNLEDSTAVIRSVSCMIFLPLDNMARIFDSLTEFKDGMPRARERAFTRGETIGPFLAVYELDEPVILNGYSEEVIEAQLTLVSPPGDDRLVHPKKDNEEVVGVCLIDGVDPSNSLAVGGILLKPADVQMIDALNFLRIADYSPTSEPNRADLIAKIEVIRNARNNEDN